MKVLPPPGPARRRQIVLLGILVVALGVLAWRQLAPTAAAPTASNSPGPVAPVGALTLPAPVKLDALVKVPENADVGRNPFGFGVRPPPPAPPRVYTPPPAPVVTAPPVPQGPPPIALKLTGMTTMPGANRPMVTLRDASGSIFQAFEGDIVDGRYRVVKVGVQSVIVSYLDGSGQRTIPLGG